MVPDQHRALAEQVFAAFLDRCPRIRQVAALVGTVEITYREAQMGLLNSTWRRTLDAAIRLTALPPGVVDLPDDQRFPPGDTSQFKIGGAPQPGFMAFKRSSHWLCSLPPASPDRMGISFVPDHILAVLDPDGPPAKPPARPRR